MTADTDWFVEARYGLFIHFGLYSLLGRGEWVMNREEIPPQEYARLADRFDPVHFDAEAIADLALAGGMKYIVFTTMHHEGFRLYDTALTDYNSVKTAAGRDFVAEIIAAARRRGLKIGLYHSLNNWYDQPDAVAALESPQAHRAFIDATFARIKELVTRYNPIDILWYDGWWPFNAEGWESERMNAMVRTIQPHILFNGRNALPGDFATPEQHLAAPNPWRPWEACVTLNDNWCYHAGDRNWKTPTEVIKLLVRIAQTKGNLLLNIGPKGDGSVPEESLRIIREVGQWLAINEEAIRGTDLWEIDPHAKGEHCGDWCSHGSFTVKGNDLYLIVTSPPEEVLVFGGLEAEVQEVILLGESATPLPFTQMGGRVTLPLGKKAEGLPCVYRFRCDRHPVIYKTGGMRTPAVPHPRYDPVMSDIAW